MLIAFPVSSAEHRNKVNRFKRRQHFRARLYRLHGTAGTFQSRNRCITIEAYNQSDRSRPRACQQLDVPGMQEIEAPIGEPDPQTLFPPFVEMLVEYSPIENNLFLRRQCRRRQYPRAKLGDSSVAVPRLPTTMAAAAFAARTADSKSAFIANIAERTGNNCVASA